jgi:3-oxoacyl-[acyl-carrier protein] reductase
MKSLEKKVAIVTGASKGIGAGIAAKLAEEGAAVVVNYSSSRESAEKVVDAIKAKGGKAIAVQADLSKPSEIERLFDESMRVFHRLDILVNNAGAYQFVPLGEVTPEHFRKLFDLNVLGLLLASKAAAKRMDSQGGAIINISSVVSRLAPPYSVVYSATKGAVDVITRVLATELGPRKIRVNAINPGVTETEGFAEIQYMKHLPTEELVSRTALGRIGKVSDIAPAVAFLASPAAGWITGELLVVSGGIS